MIYGYPQPGKAKSLNVLQAFVAGAGGYVMRDGILRIGAAAFYGTIGLEDLFRRVRELRENGRDWFYLDNAFFDRCRQRFYRVGRNALQSAGAPDQARLEQLGIEIQPWKTDGRHIVIVEQSDYYMREVARWEGGAPAWRKHVLRILKDCTDRPVILRPWLQDKAKASRSLAQDLAGAWALITHSSAAANEALLAGVPVIVTDEKCVARELGVTGVQHVECPFRPSGRREWAARLAGAQWTLDEMRAGTAWRALQSEEATQ